MNKPLVLLGEAMGSNEVKTGTPFVGAAGIELLRMLDDAGVIKLTSEDTSYISRFWNESKPEHIDMVWRLHPELYRTNVFKFHPHGNDMSELYGDKIQAIKDYPLHRGGKQRKTGYIRREFIPHLEALADEIARIDPNLVVALGNTPLWALCGTTGISKIRGTTRLSTHTISGYKVLPTYHPSAVLQQWELRPTTIQDLIKAGREQGFAEIRRPKRQIWIEPTLEDLDEFYARYIVGCNILSTDIETSGNLITCIGFSPSPSHALVVPFFDPRKKNRSYWSTQSAESRAWGFVQRILNDRSIRKVFQNGLYDLAFTWRSIGIPTYGADEDTMLLHHSLQPESLKGLGFLGSIYSDEGAWKQERKVTTIKADE